MKRILLLVLSSCVALSAPAFAALGDSEDKVAEAYGEPVDAGFPDKNGVTTNMYRKGDYMILVQFLRRLSLAESYTRTDKHDLSEKELSTFLEANSNGRTWIKNPDKLAWERNDHRAKAWCDTLSGRPTLLMQAR